MSGKKVIVSGGASYIGSQLVLDLLDKGYTVHTTLRKNNPDRVSHLTSHINADNLKIFEADLLIPDSFDEAAKGCDAAFHVASPFTYNAKDPVTEIIQPAVQGTKNFLGSCEKTGIKKVILTSSGLAIFTKSPSGALSEKVHTEEDWNDYATATFNPYAHSKAEAERVAWEYVKEKDIKLIVINPVLVFGPSPGPMISESVQILLDIAKGKSFGLIDITNPIVDVRDVSESHIRALESDTASGRYICSGLESKGLTFSDYVEAAKNQGFHPVERDLTSPFFSQLFKLMSRIIPGQAGQQLRVFIGTHTKVSTEKIRSELGMKFRNPSDTISETYSSLITWGHLSKPEM